MKAIRIASSIDENYAIPLQVLLESLTRQLGAGWRLELWLLHVSLRAETLRRIAERVDLHEIRLTSSQTASLPAIHPFPREAAAPLLLAEVIPADIDRILFLDADTLAFDDVAPLWQTDLRGLPVAAVVDGAIPFCSSPRGVKNWEAAGIPPDAPYFNAGVFLADLTLWRRQDVAGRVRAYLAKANHRIDFLHQEGLNAILRNQWVRLPRRWNLPASMAGRPFDPLPSDDWKSPGIVHFAGRMKPWRVPVGGPFNDRYQEVLRSVQPGPLRPSTVELVESAYDRHLRDLLYPVERFLWIQRLL